MKYVLINTRHYHRDIDNLPAIFESIDTTQIFDFDYHKKVIHECLENFKDNKLELYVTGLTPLLISVINYCRMFNIDIILYHYDTSIRTYVRQSVV